MSRVTDLANALTLQGIATVSIYLTGPETAPTSVEITYAEGTTPAQEAQGDAIAAAWDWRPHRLRVLYDIWVDVGALTAAQKTNIANDLFAGSPPRLARDVGPNAPDLLILWTLNQVVGLGINDKNMVRQSAIAIFAMDNPSYLTHPEWDPSIFVPGDEPVP